MASNVSDAGGQLLLNVLFGATAKPTTFVLSLFTDANPVADANNNTTHTKASGGGYADINLSNNATISTVGGIPVATWTAQAFIFTGVITAGAITGYQVVTGTTLLFEETFASTYTPLVNNDTLTITPSFVLGNGTPL